LKDLGHVFFSQLKTFRVTLVEMNSADANLKLNVGKSKLMICPKKGYRPSISIPGVQNTYELKLLGLTITSDLKWNAHIKETLSRCNRRLYALRILKPISSRHHLSIVFSALICSVLDYASPVFVCLPRLLSLKVDRFLNRCHRILHDQHCKCGLIQSFDQMRYRCSSKLFAAAESRVSHPLHEIIPKRLQHSGHLIVDYTKTTRRQATFAIHMAIFLNSVK